MSAHGPMPWSAWIFPALAVLLFAAATALGFTFTPSAAGLLFAAVLLVILFGTVFAAVHHAEVIAERIGEPYGTLLLTLAVTVIEVALIATIMLGDKAVPALARDTVFAVVMIVCNGLVGVCILAGGLRYREQDFQVTGANLYLSVLIVLATITLILPNYTLTTPGPLYSAAQLGFVSVVTIFLYGVFLYTQTIRHRDYFIIESDGAAGDAGHTSNRTLISSAALLLISLLAVVLLAKKFSLVVDAGAAAIGAPPAFAGILVALLILLPQKRPAEERQSGAGLIAGDHWPDDSGGRGGGLCARQDADSRPRPARDGAAGDDVLHQHADLRHRPHQHPVRAGSCAGVCGIRVHGIRAVTCRERRP
jgi:Ca2+:H+ antiporter